LSRKKLNHLYNFLLQVILFIDGLGFKRMRRERQLHNVRGQQSRYHTSFWLPADHVARHTLFGNDDRALTCFYLFGGVPSRTQDSAVPLIISRLGVRNRNSFMKQNDA